MRLHPPCSFALAFCLAATPLVTALPAQTDWTLTSPTTSPTARTKGQLTHILTAGQVLMFGGIDNSQIYLNETWTWNGSTWTQENPTNVPPGRIQSRLVFDLARNAVVMWSGYPGGNNYVQDLWEWTPNGGAPGNSGDWAQVQAQPGNTWPVARDHMAMAYDLPRLRTLMFGGWSYFAGQTLFNDLWAWDGTLWAQLQPSNAPPSGRDGHDMALDEARGQLVVFGGGRAFSAPLGDTWTYDLANNSWTQRTPATSPSPRFNHSMAYDAARERVVLYGGRTATQTFGDVWEWDGSNWSQRTTIATPTTRQYGRLAYDPLQEHIVMFGGDINSPFGGGNNETWLYAPTTPARWLPFGAGCRGNNPSAAAPNLTGGPRLWLGDTGSVNLSGLPPQSLALLTAGFSNTTSPLGPLPFNMAPLGLTLNCQLYVDPVSTVALISSNGAATLPLSMPTNPAFLGFSLFLQGAASDGASNFVISNAIEGVIGGR